MEELVGTFVGDGALWSFRWGVDRRIVVVDFEKHGPDALRAHAVIVVGALTMHWFDSFGDVVVLPGDVEPLVFDGDGVHVELSVDDDLLDYAVEVKTAAIVVEGSCRRARPPENQLVVTP